MIRTKQATLYQDPAVASVFEAYPAAMHRNLLALRALIFATAAGTPGVGEVEETRAVNMDNFSNRSVIYKINALFFVDKNTVFVYMPRFARR